MISKGSILIVDDEADLRESLRMILQPMYDVHTAENGQEAINFISQEKVDLVTLDLNMPGLWGIEVLQEIKKLQPDIEVMIVTGYGTLANAQEAIRFGAGGFVSKPFTVADIITGASKAIERRNQNLKIQRFNPANSRLRSPLLRIPKLRQRLFRNYHLGLSPQSFEE